MQIRFVGGPLDGLCQVVYADMKEYTRPVPSSYGEYKYAHYVKSDHVVNGVVDFTLKSITDTQNGK